MMEKPMSNFGFKVMIGMFKIRDLISPRKNVLSEVGIKTGDHVLDYGCGPGGYILPLENLVGRSGKIYALDIHPLAINRIEKVAKKRNLTNVHAILSDCQTNLEDESLEVVLLYDIFHILEYPDKVLVELHRVLKPHGIMSFSDHHMKDDGVVPLLTTNGLFKMSKKGKKTITFEKVSKK
jgi:ubiquinone/menaquinone biosynthesis C-methylase UbiE